MTTSSTTSVSTTGTITSLGVGSGLDVDSIITSLMAVESEPLDSLKTAATSINTKISDVAQLKSLMSDVQTAAQALDDSTLWTGTTASTSATAPFTVSTEDGATAGSYSVAVQSLATAQTVVASTALASSSSTLSAGSLVIQGGSWSGDTFSASSTSSTTLSIAAGTKLSDLVTQINSANAGVTASIVSDSSGARLMLRSSSTGAANGFEVTGTDGASAFTYTGSSSTTMTQSQAAGDAQATIDGVSVTSSSNTLTNVADGLTLTLTGTSTTPSTVTVASDTSSMQTAIQGFVTAYNTLASYLKTNTAYDASTSTAGELQGDSTALTLQRQMRQYISDTTSTSSLGSTLSSIGITMGTDGTLSIDSTKLTKALAQPTELAKMMTSDGDTEATKGFAQRFVDLSSTMLDSDGVFATRTSALQASLKTNSTKQTAEQTRLDKVEARLKAQYTALDTEMAKLNNLSSYLTQQITSWNKSSSDS